ncbi:MAG: hypothetical protein WCK05_12115, partial [Planctomycetota bacterium]
TEEHMHSRTLDVRVDDGYGRDNPLNLIVEVTGPQKAGKVATVAIARDLWIPAANNAGAWGRWGFVEIAYPWDANGQMRSRARQG